MKKYLLLSILAIGAMFSVLGQTTVTIEDSVICAGSSTYILASGADMYVWSDSNNLDTIVGDSVNFSTTQPGTYTITVVGVTMPLFTTDTVVFNIHVNPLPVVSISSSATPDGDFICIGDSAVLTASAAGAASFLWSPATGLNNTTTATVVASPTTQITTYEVEVTDSNGCVGTATKQVKVNSTIPALAIETDLDSICPGDTTELEVKGSIIGNFSWTPTGAFTPTTDPKIILAHPATTTTYTVTNSFNACESSTSLTVKVLTIPTLTFTQESGGASICLDETDSITINCSSCTVYRWGLPNSTLTTTGNGLRVSPNDPGAIQITVRGYVSEGSCPGYAYPVVNVNDCFVGTPFGISDLDQEAAALSAYFDGTSISLQIDGAGSANRVEIYDLLGNKVIDRSVQMVSDRTEMIDASGLANGAYLIVATGDAEILSKRIVIAN